MTTIPGHHMMSVKDINDSGEVFAALLRDHEELVTEVHRLREEKRNLRHWARIWKMAATVQRYRRKIEGGRSE